MIQEIVSIFDNKALAFLKPVFVQSTGAAVRSFADAVNDNETDFAKHPADYAMWHIGSYDDSTAQFIPLANGNIELAKAQALVETT